MLKIDLLPGYVREKQLVRTTFMLLVALLAVEAMGIGGYYTMQSKTKESIIKKIADIEDDVSKAKKLETDISAEQGKLPPIATLVTFYKDSLGTAPQSIDVYRGLFKYVYSRAQLNNVQLTSTTATVAGRITGVDSLGQFLLNFMRCPVFSSVQFGADLQPFSFGGGGGGGGGQPGGPGGPAAGPGPGGAPGAAPGGAPAGGGVPAGAQAAFFPLPTQQVTFTLNCTLTKPITTPGAAAAGAAPGGPPGAAGPGGPGAPPGAGGPGGPGGPAGPPPAEGGKAGAKGGSKGG